MGGSLTLGLPFILWLCSLWLLQIPFPLAAMKNSVVIVFSSLAQIYNTLDRFTIFETDKEINKQKSVWAIVKF